MPTGIYYGDTKYSGETNKNRIKRVSLFLSDDTKLADLGRNLWKKYDKEAGVDGLKWLGYSDGESIRITVYKDKVLEDMDGYIVLVKIEPNMVIWLINF